MNNINKEKIARIEICASVAAGEELLYGNLKDLRGQVAIVGNMSVPLFEKELEVKATGKEDIGKEPNFDIEFVNNENNEVLEGEDEPII